MSVASIGSEGRGRWEDQGVLNLSTLIRLALLRGGGSGAPPI